MSCNLTDEQRIQSSQPYHEVHAAVYSQTLDSVPTSSAPPVFLKSTGIAKAWTILNKDVTATIAIVDTGVDFNHPELKSYLLEGKNLIDEGKPPQDDNGHGTAVAGVIAAVAKASEASEQAMWKGRVLPIKALDQYGSGDEGKLTQGIHYAVDQGADIIVLSLGLRRDAPGLRDAVSYAESKGVLLVAASGNDAAVFGAKAAVQYPAAYPSVLAVAGSEGTQPISQSTAGPENDLSAAWRVQTLAIGGGIVKTEGTSMGAPQVAAAAAMLMAVHPDWKPLRLREALRRSAQNNGTTVWNKNIGYGFLSVNKALQADLLMDWREPNDKRILSSVFPIGKEVSGSWRSSTDKDWYTFEVLYDGIYFLSGDEMRLTLYNNEGLIEPSTKPSPQSGIISQWTVKKGRYWLEASSSEDTPSASEGYRLVSQFRMSADAREPNNSAVSAGTLPARSQQWSGNFHQLNDEDWFVVTLPKAGSLRLSVTTNTTRIDPKLWVQPAGGTAKIVDKGGDGDNEQWSLKGAKAGKYYLRITNAVSSNPEAVIGTYAATLEYITEKEDAFEPNEGPLTSTPLSPDKVYYGLMNSNKDQDWYRFTITQEQKVKLSLGLGSHSNANRVELRDKKLQTLKKWNMGLEQKALFGEIILPPGIYYVTVTSDKAIRNQGYGIRVKYVDN
ncbi:S8 family serine peptidase [Cohnella sp.]|uniref:S8 family serine peptidase n=1 Tax=Cohnella sp. TaxID=1883426 RepID=UPI00356B3E3A